MPGRSVDSSLEGPLRSSLDLAVGDLVVYASHGIGRVESTRAAGPKLSQTVVLVFESGLRVTLPHSRACESLRPLAGANDLEDVRHALHAHVPATTEPWSRRFRATQEKVAGGSVTALAEVVRDGMQRERRLAGANGRAAAPSERELYRQARKLLAAEIAACRGIDEATADAWIVEQICGEST